MSPWATSAAGISGRTEPTLVLVGNHRTGTEGWPVLVGPLPAAPLQKGVVVIHADDDLHRGPALVLHRRHRMQEERPPSSVYAQMTTDTVKGFRSVGGRCGCAVTGHHDVDPAFSSYPS